MAGDNRPRGGVEAGHGAGGDPGGDARRRSQRYLRYVLALTGVVVVFALLLAFWMYWLGAQLPG